MTFNAEARRKGHAPAARRKAVATRKRIMAWKKMQGIPSDQKLTPEQKRAFRAGGASTVSGSIPIAALGKKPQPGAHSAARRYLTNKRVDLAADVVQTFKSLRAGKQSALAEKFLHVLGTLLNGGAQ